MVQVVGEPLTLLGTPLARTGAPCLGRRNGVVDVDAGSIGHRPVVIGRMPLTGGGPALRVDHHAGAVALQHRLPGGALTRDSAPVRENFSRVATHGPLCGHREPLQHGARGIGIKTLRDPIPIDTTDTSPMAELAVALLALFARMERTFMRERAAHAREVGAAVRRWCASSTCGCRRSAASA